MRLLRALLISVCLLGTTASLASAQTPAVPSDRLGFDAHQEPADSTFMVEIDGQRSPLLNVTCGALVNGAAPCSAPIPAMTLGKHTIRIVGILTVAGQSHETPASLPLDVTFIVLVAPDNVRIVKG